jgi:valyl-tRNA synthetase
MTELQKQYDPKTVEPAITARWLAAKAFAAHPDARENRYVIMMPLPNVTGALHMGHAMDNVMQDVLTRWHRMRGDNTLWMAGTDHAGIGTQALVEKRIFELEGKTRNDLGREELVRRIWAWKDQYQQRIVAQQQAMGCSCDWDRQRFTMDKVCARAVRHAFFKMFRDGLIYQGYRLVNWDCHLRTAVADDELYKAEIEGHFWYLRYPVIDPQPGEPQHVLVATTRPETMLGDTAVACHPDPAGALAAALAAAQEKLRAASKRDAPEAEAEIERLTERRSTHLALLQTVARMARAGRRVRLPLLGREIPIILDGWAKPELGTGCVKITPAHDPNDYDVWQRHRDEIGIVNILEPDGTLNTNAGRFAGMERFAARAAVVEALRAEGLLERVEERVIEIDHSDRSKTIIEPFLSKQWFVRMGDVPGGVRMGRGTPREFTAAGLAQAAIDAADPEWRSATGRNVTFHPDPRYLRTYRAWLAEKRDWCISRQLWWGHQIPVWRGEVPRSKLLNIESLVLPALARDDVAAWVIAGEERLLPREAFARCREADAPDALEVQICFLDPQVEQKLGPMLATMGLAQEQDVLDTWFSSALWPHSTLGWPDPATAEVDPGQPTLAATEGRPDCLSYYYPGSCLVTGRDIITLWVARMVILGLYDLGDVPFTDVFIHATILDGKGERMSKSKGNGIDPVDLIDRYGADAVRYLIADMQTGTQDVKLPVQVDSPFTGKTLALADLFHGRTIFTYVCPDTGDEFDVLGTLPDVPAAKPYSVAFEEGRNFCNKLWNSARFAFLNLEGARFEPRRLDEVALEDRWILSRLSRARDEVHEQLAAYNPSAALAAARRFFWSEFCDWYLEIVKPRMRDEQRRPLAQQVLAATLDSVLRLLHPFVPFITEALWERLGEAAPRRGIDRELPASALLVHAAWPEPRPDWRDDDAEAAVALAREVTAKVRDIRARYRVAASQQTDLVLVPARETAPALAKASALIAHLTSAARLEIATAAPKLGNAATAVVAGIEVHVPGVVDVAAERQKLGKQSEQLTGRIAALRGKLANESFLAKAPPEVVARERKNLEALESELQSVAASLLALGPP